MSNWRVYFWIGLGLFVLGGALLAFGWEQVGVGTTLGLAGLGLTVWAWIRRQVGPGS